MNNRIRRLLETLYPVLIYVAPISSLLLDTILKNIFIIPPTWLISESLLISTLIIFVVNIATILPIFGEVILVVLMTIPIFLGRGGKIYLAFYLFFFILILVRMLLFTQPPEEI